MTPNARATLDRILQLPKDCAGLKAVTIENNLRILASLEITPEEYGDRFEEAQIAIATVQSALAELRDAAYEREGRMP